MDMLGQLRNKHFKRQEKNTLRLKVLKQFEQITKLRRQKEQLSYRLMALGEGQSVTDLYPSDLQDPEIISAHKKLASLRQQLSAYRLIGPCGLTVLDVSPASLVVSFMSVWKDLTQSFVLHVTDRNDSIEITDTNIPYFIDVPSMVAGVEVTDWPKVMDNISCLLNALTRRKREVEHIRNCYKSEVKQISYNDPVTVVDIYLNTSSASSQPSSPDLQIDVNLVYKDIQATYPQKVRLSSSHPLSMEVVQQMRKFLSTEMLSDAVPLLLDQLSKFRLDEVEGDDDEEDVDD